MPLTPDASHHALEESPIAPGFHGGGGARVFPLLLRVVSIEAKAPSSPPPPSPPLSPPPSPPVSDESDHDEDAHARRTLTIRALPCLLRSRNPARPQHWSAPGGGGGGISSCGDPLHSPPPSPPPSKVSDLLRNATVTAPSYHLALPGGGGTTLEMPVTVRLSMMMEWRRRSGFWLEADAAAYASMLEFATDLKSRYEKAVRREGSWGLLLGFTKRPKLQALLAFQRLGGRMALGSSSAGASESPSKDVSGNVGTSESGGGAPNDEIGANDPAAGNEQSAEDAEVAQKLRLCIEGVESDKPLLEPLLVGEKRARQRAIVDKRRAETREAHNAILVSWLPAPREKKIKHAKVVGPSEADLWAEEDVEAHGSDKPASKHMLGGSSARSTKVAPQLRAEGVEREWADGEQQQRPALLPTPALLPLPSVPSTASGIWPSAPTHVPHANRHPSRRVAPEESGAVAASSASSLHSGLRGRKSSARVVAM